MLLCETYQKVDQSSSSGEITVLTVRMVALSDDPSISIDIKCNRDIELPKQLQTYFNDVNPRVPMSEDDPWPPILPDGWNISFVRNVSTRIPGHGIRQPGSNDYAVIASEGEKPWNGPFHVDPKHHLIGLKFQFPASQRKPDQVWLFNFEEFIHYQGPGQVRSPEFLRSEGWFHTLNGRRLIFGTGDRRIVSEDLNPSASRFHGWTRAPVRDPLVNYWYSQTYHIPIGGNNDRHRNPNMKVQAVTTPIPYATRVVITEDNLIILAVSPLAPNCVPNCVQEANVMAMASGR